MPEGSQQYQLPNRKLPRVSSVSEPALADMINQIAEALETAPANREFVAGHGIRIINDKDTTIVELGEPPSRKVKWYPFKLYQSDPDKGLRVNVFYGTIDNIVPIIKVERDPPAGGETETDDVALNAQVKANTVEQTEMGHPWVTAQEDAGEYIVYLAYTPNNPCTEANEAEQTPPEVKITESLNESIPEDTATLGHVELGRVTVEDVGGADGVETRITKINQSVTHSLMHSSCGVSHYFWGV